MFLIITVLAHIQTAITVLVETIAIEHTLSPAATICLALVANTGLIDAQACGYIIFKLAHI